MHNSQACDRPLNWATRGVLVKTSHFQDWEPQALFSVEYQKTTGSQFSIDSQASAQAGLSCVCTTQKFAYTIKVCHTDIENCKNTVPNSGDACIQLLSEKKGCVKPGFLCWHRKISRKIQLCAKPDFPVVLLITLLFLFYAIAYF